MKMEKQRKKKRKEKAKTKKKKSASLPEEAKRFSLPVPLLGDGGKKKKLVLVNIPLFFSFFVIYSLDTITIMNIKAPVSFTLMGVLEALY